MKTKKPKLPVNPELKARVKGLIDFLNANDFKPLHTEKKVYDIYHRFAGTLDCEGYLNGKLSIIDFKNSTGIYDEYRYQTACYLMARWREDQKYYDARHIIRIDNDGSVEMKEYGGIDSEDYLLDIQAFLGYLNVWYAKKGIRK